MNEELETILKYLRLWHLLAQWDELLAAARRGRFSHERLLRHVLAAEYHAKNDNARVLRRKRAHIPEPLEIETFRGMVNGVVDLVFEHAGRFYIADYKSNYLGGRLEHYAPEVLAEAGPGLRRMAQLEAYHTFYRATMEPEYLDRATTVLSELVAEVYTIEIVPERVYRPVAAPSDIDNEMFQALERVAADMYPDAIVLPKMSTGATDMAQVRAMGVPAYGIGPIRTQAELNSGNGAHSDNERVSEDAMIEFLQFMWAVVIDVAASQ